ncbi:MAG: restriction endonuclease PLD domain-containing protein, partial [Gemmatimonadota bacterium]
MRYIDSGSREPSDALGTWLAQILAEDAITEVRWQAGFYTLDGLGLFVPTLNRLRAQNGRVIAVVGSNNGDTLRVDIERLFGILGLPRDETFLGVISYTGGFFHPKAYHFTRRDGSQAAYVGSANLTAAGIGSLHIEAGVVFDAREGDSRELLTSIQAGIDYWTADARQGVTPIRDMGTIAQLAAQGILSEAPTARAMNQRRGGNENLGRPRLTPLITLPAFEDTPILPRTAQVVIQQTESAEQVNVSESQVEWEPVWRSNALSERDLSIPSGTTTNPTGSIGLRKGDWDQSIDHRHYFRDDVFGALPWSPDPRRANREITSAIFELWINGSFVAETALTISHNTDTSSTTYKQFNEMTHLRWGEAKELIADKRLLGAVLTLYRD